MGLLYQQSLKDSGIDPSVTFRKPLERTGKYWNFYTQYEKTLLGRDRCLVMLNQWVKDTGLHERLEFKPHRRDDIIIIYDDGTTETAEYKADSHFWSPNIFVETESNYLFGTLGGPRKSASIGDKHFLYHFPDIDTLYWFQDLRRLADESERIAFEMKLHLHHIPNKHGDKYWESAGYAVPNELLKHLGRKMVNGKFVKW